MRCPAPDVTHTCLPRGAKTTSCARNGGTIVRSSLGRRASRRSSSARRADFDPSDVQSAVPSGLTETCRAGPGTCVRDTTRPRPTSSATTSSLAESVTYAIDRFGCTAVYRGAVKPSSSTRTSRAAASTIETSPCRLCATTAILVSTLSMLRGPGAVSMRASVRPLVGLRTTTWLSRSAVTSTSDPPRGDARPRPP